MSIKINIPDLKLFMEEEIQIQLKNKLCLKGTLRGFDQFLNIVLEKSSYSKESNYFDILIVRGNSIMSVSKL
uniref:Sm protein G n=1 Tax=Bigelowiella natans TaxID=227086 RepID=Q40942_BIGNA|nr:small nucleolar ribonucleoprotein E homolog [Bigelowiella natans]